MLDIPLLKFISNRDAYTRFRKHIKNHTIVKETGLLLADIDEYFKNYTDVENIDWQHFRVWFNMVKHGSWEAEKKAAYDLIFKRVESYGDVEPAIVNKFIELDYTAQVREVCDKVIRGESAQLEIVAGLLERYIDELGNAGKSDEDYFVTSNIADILDDLVRSKGLEWRLEDLNVSIGPIHGGDFIIVGARPETGKTTFLCSEFTHLTKQLPEDKEAIIFNNEEDGRKIFARLIQSALKYTLLDIAVDDKKAEKLYIDELGSLDRIKVVHKENNLSIYDIERYLKSGKYGLVGINVLDKVRGFEKDENEVSRMRKLAQFVRNTAIKYKVAVIAVMQADASAEGKTWLDQSQLYGTKTGVQGEADVIIMIGRSPESAEQDKRYLSVAKNKLPGGSRTQPDKRHGKFTVYFDQERGRYESKDY